MPIDLKTFPLRMSPQYDLVPFNRLSQKQREFIGELASDGRLFGILLPQPGAMGTVKAASHEIAALLQDMPMAPNLNRQLGDPEKHEIVRLVADGVLEIKSGNAFISGIEALRALDLSESHPVGSGPIAELSQRALELAACFPAADLMYLSSRLYAYNRLPLTPDLTRQFTGGAAVETYLQISPGGALDINLAQNGWQRQKDSGEASYWLSWHCRAHKNPGGDDPIYKLYLSIQSDSLPNAISLAVPLIATSHAFHFKLGGTIDGILRPDKFVVYFASFDDLMALASELKPGLHNLRAHGVPFTADLGDQGHLSWGIDPPSSDRGPRWQPRESWRLRVTNRLASALISAASRSYDAATAVQFALDRISLDGVDVTSWTPSTGKELPAV